MRRIAVLLPVVFAFLVGAAPASAWTWPVEGPVMQPFSVGTNPYAGGQHRGIDIGAPSGAEARAPASGLVSFAGVVPRGGLSVTIRTEDGYAVTLVHLGGVSVTKGERVLEGAVVGAVGPSGELEHATPYVHLGIRVAADENGYVDPLLLLPPLDAESGQPDGAAMSEQPVTADEAGDAGAASGPTPEQEAIMPELEQAAGEAHDSGSSSAASGSQVGEGVSVAPDSSADEVVPPPVSGQLAEGAVAGQAATGAVLEPPIGVESPGGTEGSAGPPAPSVHIGAMTPTVPGDAGAQPPGLARPPDGAGGRDAGEGRSALAAGPQPRAAAQRPERAHAEPEAARAILDPENSAGTPLSTVSHPGETIDDGSGVNTAAGPSGLDRGLEPGLIASLAAALAAAALLLLRRLAGGSGRASSERCIPDGPGGAAAAAQEQAGADSAVPPARRLALGASGICAESPGVRLRSVEQLADAA